MRALLVQLDLAWEDAATNHALVRDRIAAASPQPGDLVVLPEMFATGFSMDVARIAEPAQGVTWQLLRALAQAYRCFVAGGFAELSSTPGKGLNTYVTLGPDGTELCRYHKIHPFSYGGEDKHYLKGCTLPTFELGPFRAATPICYDLRFPELFRQASHQGANLFIVPASWPAARKVHWRLLAQARALENLSWVVAVNRTGEGGGLSYPGATLVVNPLGEIVFEADEAEQVAVVELPFEVLQGVRERFHFLDDVRCDLFPDLFKGRSTPE